MSVFDYEVASAFGGVDADTYSTATVRPPYSAHMLRAMAMAGNRMAASQHHVTTLAWPMLDNPVDGFDRALLFHAYPVWREVVPPIRLRLMPGRTKLAVRVRAFIETDKVVLLSFETRSQLPRESVRWTDPQALEMVGTGAWATYALDDCPVVTDTLEPLCRVLAAGPIGDKPSGHGAVAGDIDSFTRSTITSVGAGWTRGSAGYAKRAVVRIFDQSGGQILNDRLVIVPPDGGVNSDVLGVHPPLLDHEMAIATQTAGDNGPLKFELLALNRCRIAAISIAAQEAEL